MSIRSDLLQNALEGDLQHVPVLWTDARCFALNNLKKTLLKKCVDDELPTAEQRALEKFRASNVLCSEWSLKCDRLFDEDLIGQFEDCVRRKLDDVWVGWSTLFQGGYSGPGASVGARETDFFTKFFNGKLTTSHEFLVRLYQSHISHFPEWKAAELHRAALHGEVEVVEGSKTSTVPKTYEIRRTICTEPSLDMWYQLGMGSVIQEWLKQYFGIGLSHQPLVNRALAKIGSVDGSFSTIDLESASDSISLKMLRRFFPRWFVGLLECLRSPVTFVKGERVQLHMVSSMGNGFTFPLQTFIFACVVEAVLEFRGVKMSSKPGKRNFAVFGDDIVVPTSCYSMVCRLLELLGFRVNAAKSFCDGSFRESCGADYLFGVNVRGLYLKTLKTPQSRYSAINRLIAFSALWEIELPRTLRYLRNSVKASYIPLWEREDGGIRVPRFMSHTSCYRVWVQRAIRFTPTCNPDGQYIAFLGGYLRDNSVTRRSREPTYSLRRRAAPNTWDGAPQDAGLVSQCGYDTWRRAIARAIY